MKSWPRCASRKMSFMVSGITPSCQRLKWTVYLLTVPYYHLRGGRLPSLGESLALLPDEAEREVVARALAPDPRKRYPSCVEFVRELAKVVRGRQSVSTRL